MKITFCLVLILFCTIAALTQTKRKPEPKFNPTGYFILANEVPKLFPSALMKGGRIQIEIRTASFEVNSDLSITPYFSIPPEGVFKDNEIGDYKFTEINLKGFQISFKTETIEDVSYTFSGRFLKGGKYYKTMPKGVVLKGQLARIRNGKMESQEDVGLTWEGGD